MLTTPLSAVGWFAKIEVFVFENQSIDPKNFLKFSKKRLLRFAVLAIHSLTRSHQSTRFWSQPRGQQTGKHHHLVSPFGPFTFTFGLVPGTWWQWCELSRRGGVTCLLVRLGLAGTWAGGETCSWFNMVKYYENNVHNVYNVHPAHDFHNVLFHQ